MLLSNSIVASNAMAILLVVDVQYGYSSTKFFSSTISAW